MLDRDRGDKWATKVANKEERDRRRAEEKAEKEKAREEERMMKERLREETRRAAAYPITDQQVCLSGIWECGEFWGVSWVSKTLSLLLLGFGGL